MVGTTVVLVGGGGQEPQSNCTLFDATTNTFSLCKSPMPTGRGFLGAAAVGTTVYAIGGYAAKGWNVVYVTESRCPRVAGAMPYLGSLVLAVVRPLMSARAHGRRGFRIFLRQGWCTHAGCAYVRTMLLTNTIFMTGTACQRQP